MRTKQPPTCFVPLQKLWARLAPQFITDRSKAVVLLWFSFACFWYQSFGDVSPYVFSYYFSSVSVAEWLPLWK